MLTEAEIVAIRDEHLPSQGDTFDCIAFARAIESSARLDQHDQCVKALEEYIPFVTINSVCDENGETQVIKLSPSAADFLKARRPG